MTNIRKTTKEDIKKTLWAAADTFRDNIDASNYKDYVLSMLFVKYLSDTFKENVEKLKEKYEGIRLERQIKNLSFVLEEECTFDYLLKNKNNIDIGSLISQALTKIEELNPILSGIFRGIDFNSQANLGTKEQKNPILRELLQDFSTLDLRPSMIEIKENEVPADVIGDAYEYMIGEFATMAGKKAGSFYTPQEVSEIMANIVDPIRSDRVYDPTCGSGSLLIRVARKAGFENVSIYIVPMVNPDGVNLVTGAFLDDSIAYLRAEIISRGFSDIPFPSGWKANINGVDLNLQFPAGWEQAREIKFSQGFTSPAPRDFVGTSALSTPEAIAMYNFTLNHNFNLVLSYHTQGKVIFWQYQDYTPEISESIANAFSRASGYSVEDTPYNSSFAGYKDWFIYQYRKPGFTIEAGLGENPLPISQFDEIYHDNIGILILGMVL